MILEDRRAELARITGLTIEDLDRYTDEEVARFLWAHGVIEREARHGG
jgi:hypothetical protein